MAAELGKVFMKEGLYFVGIDVRGEKLIEVNVTSPAGLVELDQLYGQRATARLAADLINSFPTRRSRRGRALLPSLH
jgi:glutathione synthase